MARADWEVVFRTGSEVEAEVVKGLLTTSEIPVIVEATGQKAMPMFFGHSAPGELLIKVPPDLAETALLLLAAEAEAAPETE